MSANHANKLPDIYTPPTASIYCKNKLKRKGAPMQVMY